MTQVAQADPEKRPVPDYDGRGNVDAHPARRWSWIPRIVLFPAYIVEEYALRRPIGWVVSKAERDRWLDTAIDTFSFGPQHNYMLLPLFTPSTTAAASGKLKFMVRSSA